MRCCGSARLPPPTWPTVARMADGSGTLTVLRSKTDQEGRGHRLITNDNVASAIEKAQVEAAERNELTLDYVLGQHGAASNG